MMDMLLFLSILNNKIEKKHFIFIDIESRLFDRKIIIIQHDIPFWNVSAFIEL